MRHKKFSSIGKDLTLGVYNDDIFITKREINTVVVHCAATPVGVYYDAYDIDDWHLDRWGPRSGCGYHYVILLDGTIQKSRWVDYPGAHVRGHNRNSIGVCYIGGVFEDNSPAFDHETPEQRQSLLRLLNLLKNDYNLKDTDILGHNEFPGVKKSCPCLDMDEIRYDLED